MDKEMKFTILKIVISFIVFLLAILLPISEATKIFLFLLAYLAIGYEVIFEAFKNIFHGEIFDENFLMMLATFGAFATKEFPEAFMVMWLFQIGEAFQEYATDKSKKSITTLMDIRPDYANIEEGSNLKQVSPTEIEIGDIIVVKPGEKIPLDGIVVDGTSSLNTSALTGESKPRKVFANCEVLSGSINQNGILKIKVTKKYTESTVSKILELVENASEKKTKSENFITKFSKYYTPFVVFSAIILAFVPPLFLGYEYLLEYIHRACSFLVISCPCALVISVPLSFFSGIGNCAKNGILIKGSNYLETISNVKTFVFDKTGTLTKGNFEISKIEAFNISKDDLIELASLCEIYSDHPIAISIKKYYSQKLDSTRVNSITEIHGNGIKAVIDGKSVIIGNDKLLEKSNIQFEKIDDLGTIIYVAVENNFVGYIVINDTLKEETEKAINILKKNNNELVMLTGDNENIAKDISKKLGLNKYYAELFPADKVEKLEDIINSKNEPVAFIGDGINDAPVLMTADLGIAMGKNGLDAAIEAADIVIMDDNISKINKAISISKKTLRIVKENIIFSLLVKFLVLILGALGIATMWWAVFADVGVSFMAILNSLRALK